MLNLLRHPVALLGAAIALLVGVVAHGVVQAAVARALGDRVPAATGRLSPDPRRHFEPFGVIVALLSVVGWNKQVPLQEPRFRGARNRYLLAVLSGPLTNLLFAVAGLAGLLAVGTDFFPVGPFLTLDASFGQQLVYEFVVVNAALGVLTLVPLPPLDGARILWLYAPRSHGWQQARYHLEERNIGVGICVALMLPLFGGIGLLLNVVLTVTGAFLAPVARAFGVDVGF